VHPAPPAVQPQPAQRPVQHAGLATVERPGAPILARRARRLVPGLPASRPPSQRPDRRSRRPARRWRCAVRHRQHAGAVPLVQLDEGCVDRRGRGSPSATRQNADWRPATVCTRPSFASYGGFSPVGCCMTADALEAVAASATMALRASLAPARHCPACGVELPYLGGRGRPRRWCDAHHPRPSRLRPRAPRGAGGPAAPGPRRVRAEIPPRDLAQICPCEPTLARVAR
jgi:hypothetical protein